MLMQFSVPVTAAALLYLLILWYWLCRFSPAELNTANQFSEWPVICQIPPPAVGWVLCKCLLTKCLSTVSNAWSKSIRFLASANLKGNIVYKTRGCGLMAPAGSSARSLNCVMSQPLGRLTWHYVENQAWGVQSTFRFGMHQLAMVPWGHLPLKWQVLRFWSGILRRYCLLPYIWYAEDEGLANVIGSTTHYRHATPAAHFPECKWASEWVLFIFFLSKYDGVQPEKSWICIGDNLVS